MEGSRSDRTRAPGPGARAAPETLRSTPHHHQPRDWASQTGNSDQPQRLLQPTAPQQPAPSATSPQTRESSPARHDLPQPSRRRQGRTIHASARSAAGTPIDSNVNTKQMEPDDDALAKPLRARDTKRECDWVGTASMVEGQELGQLRVCWAILACESGTERKHPQIAVL
jgi:hypothetical protein